MSLRSFSLTLSALLIAQAPSALASEHLDLDAAVARALSYNPEIRAAAFQIRAAQSREVQAAALPNPNLTLMIDQVPLANFASGNYMAGISQPLFIGGQREARMELARLERELSELEQQLLVRDLTSQVKAAYARLLFAREEVRLAQLNDEASLALLKATEARHSAGELAKVELLRSQVERSRSQREVEANRARESQALGELNILLGNEAQTALEIEAPMLQAPSGLPPANRLAEIALARRLELRQSALQIERETVQRRLAQAGQWTGTEASVSGGAVGGQPGFSSGLSLPIPLYRQQGEIAEAEANRGRAEAQRDALRQRITLDVELAYRSADIASRQADAFQHVYLPQAERLADNASRRFAVGEGSGLEVLEGRRALQQVRTEYQQALLNYRQALAGLERAIGGNLP